MMSNVDLAYYEEISGLLRGLLISLEDRLPAEAVAQTSEFIDVNELGLALEWMADALSDEGQAITAAERATVPLASMIEGAGRQQQCCRGYRQVRLLPCWLGRSSADICGCSRLSR
jgi:hypothetical protein